MGEEARVADLLEGFLERRARGEAVDLAELCAAHPEHAERLRSLSAAVDRLDAALSLAAGRSPFHERLASVYGDGADPGIELEPPATAADSGSEVLARLVRRAGGVGRYRLQDEVARGGQGAVLRVWDEDLRRPLAMKVSLERASAKEESARSIGRFLEEAQVTGQLDHPGIVPVHELGLDAEGRVYFVMKLVKGRDLRAILAQVRAGEEGWTRTRALGVLLKVCEAMAYAHSKGVVHRDLKPANVMVGRFGEVYVMDWGLARVLGHAGDADARIEGRSEGVRSSARERGRSDQDPRLLTREGDVIGTPAYMPPEQARGDRNAIGPRSDVYSAGAMLYELLAGHAPYVEPAARVDNVALWRRVQSAPPARLSSIARARDVPPELVAICEKAMAREAAARYRDMSELAEDLRAYLERRVVRAYETGAVAELRKWVARNRGLAGAIAASVVLALLGLAATGYVEARGRRKAEKSELRARDQELAAKREQANVMRLSAVQRLADLEREADGLWPAEPRNIPQYHLWLERARELVAGLDPRGDDTGHRARLAQLRGRTLALTDAERAAERRAHPRFGELEALASKVAALRRAQAVREGAAQSEPVQLDVSSLPSDAVGLLELARPLVHPDRTEFGREAEGLALARLAVERVETDRIAARAWICLAWALFACGLDREALAESEAALATAPEDERSAYERHLKELRGAVDGAQGGASLVRAEAELERLDGEVNSARVYRFADEQDAWWHNQLENLVGAIEALADPETGLIDGVSPEHGWGIRRRLTYAETIESRSVSGERAAPLWAKAIASIGDREACPAYGGLRIAPQLGLVPLGRDPDSGLFEFAHLATGEPAERGAEGRLALKEETGLVFVLLPGGTAQIGAQRKDPNGPNYDPNAESIEYPVDIVTESPFFLSKYEMTQGQWLRMTGGNPSAFPAMTEVAGKTTTPLHPVENVSWTACTETLRRLGLELPAEVQWEYAARAGTTTPWPTGSEKESLNGAANLADVSYRRVRKEALVYHENWLDDGYYAHGPVGTRSANAFGLHDVIGNVGEWSRSRGGQDGGLVYRGGSFEDTAAKARSAARDKGLPEYSSLKLGLRPARRIEP